MRIIVEDLGDGVWDIGGSSEAAVERKARQLCKEKGLDWTGEVVEDRKMNGERVFITTVYTK